MWPWMTEPLDKDIQFVSGDDFSLPLNLQTPTSGYTFEAYFTLGSGQVPFSVLNGDPQNGVVALQLSAEVTGTVPAGVYAWQFSYLNLNNHRTTWAQGLLTVLGNV